MQLLWQVHGERIQDGSVLEAGRPVTRLSPSVLRVKVRDGGQAASGICTGRGNSAEAGKGWETGEKGGSGPWPGKVGVGDAAPL